MRSGRGQKQDALQAQKCSSQAGGGGGSSRLAQANVLPAARNAGPTHTLGVLNANASEGRAASPGP